MSYPKPSPIGGTIIRKVMALLKENQISLPMNRPILIATSGGVDSMVLAHLISKYGRRIIDPKKIILLHFDHGWRKESGTVEKKAVQQLAKELEVSFLSVKLKTQRQKTMSKNLEEDARMKRNEYYASHTGSVFTAHHADDVVETLVWRFFRGELFKQNEGILFQDNNVLRPFLKVTKEEIYLYAQSESVSFFEDPSNDNLTQMRAFFRKELKPLLLKQFPGFRNSVLSYAAQRKAIRKKSE
jgi:tRNA(Ile)-lysidine synthase